MKIRTKIDLCAKSNSISSVLHTVHNSIIRMTHKVEFFHFSCSE